MKVQSYQLVNPENQAQATSGLNVQESKLEIRFVSLLEKRQIQDIDLITELLNRQGYSVDHFEYKVVKKSEIRRPINPKVQNSPKERVTVEERINVNAHLKTVGQLEWRVLKDPENVLLIQIHRSKGETLSLPLFFENIFNNNHQILVTGLTNAVKVQLLSKPDLKFQRIPELIEKDPIVKEQLLKRASRSKGMQSTVRELIDFPGLPKEMADKISAIASGKNEHLSDPQAINLILLADLHNRYAATFQNFQSEIVERAAPVAQLARQFEILTQRISTKYLVARLSDFLGENASECRTSQQVFSYLYQKLQQMEEKQIYVNKKLLDRKDLFKLLKSLVCITRSQYDPELWKRCYFFLSQDDEQTLPEENEQNIRGLVSNLQGNAATQEEASASTDLKEIYLIHNIYDYVVDKRLAIAEEAVSPQEAGFLKGAVAPRLHIRLKKEGEKKNPGRLFAEPKQAIQKLIHPVQFLSGAYGVLIGEILKENLSKFFDFDKRELIERFGRHFFDVLYEQAVFERGLHISRNQFAGWLQESGLFSQLEELGFIENEIETDSDIGLTPHALTGSGAATYPPEMDNAEFEKLYVKSRNTMLSFIDKIKRSQKAQKNEFNPAGIILDFFAKGKYDLRSHVFRKHARQTFLYEELHNIVKACCLEFKGKLAEQSKNKKLILQLPLKYANILFIGNTFEVPTGKFIVQLRLHAIPVREMTEDQGLSHAFSANFSKALNEAETEQRKGLIQAMRILGEYQKVSTEFVKAQSIAMLDRILYRVEMKQKLINRDPRYIKFKMPDVDKMIIGSIRDVNMNKLFQYDMAKAGGLKKITHSQTFGEMVQSVIYFRSVIESLEARRDTINEIKMLLNRFSKSLKKSQEWKAYSTLVIRIGELISLPIHAMSEKVIKLIMDLSIKLNRLVTKHEYKNSVIAILHAEWKRKNPERSKEVYFYLPFLGDEAPRGKTNLLLEIRKARDLIRILKTKRAIIFFPGATKEIQLNQMVDIADFIAQQSLSPEMYVETSNLNEDKRRQIAKRFYPDCFFNIDQLEPIKMPMRQQHPADANQAS